MLCAHVPKMFVGLCLSESPKLVQGPGAGHCSCAEGMRVQHEVQLSQEAGEEEGISGILT